ncbi:MAG: septal ring lytic transglycosylase RlpA family protein [Sideroxydans sp.]
MNRSLLLLPVLVLLSACVGPSQKMEPRQGPAAPVVEHGATVPQGGGYLAGDGPGAEAPVNLDAIPDAVPRAEPLHKYANRPYSALGKQYTPLTTTGNYKERGIASWYGKKFHGQHTSIGEIYDMYGMTAAHPTLPIPSYARVTNLANGKTVIVRINDRGPFLHERIMDLSYAAAYKLGYIEQGSAEVEVESIAVDAAAPTPQPAVAQATPAASEPVAAPVIPVATAVAGGQVFLQLGAFRAREGAQSFLGRMTPLTADSGKQLSLRQKRGLTRVWLGPYTNANEARQAAARLQAKLGFKPFIGQP